MLPLLPGEPRDLAALYRALGRLASAGIPPIQQAALLREPRRGRMAAKAADVLARALASGALPSRALGSTRAVPPSHVALVAAGETSGTLDLAWDRLASACEEEARLRAEGWRLAMEPLMLWLVASLVLPAPRIFSAGWGAYAAVALPMLAALPLGFALLHAAREHLGAAPGFGEPARLLAAARACRTVALFNGAGLPLPKSLRAAADAAAHAVLSPRLAQAATRVERGSTLNDALRAEAVLRPTELALVADGEVTGRLDVAFERAARLLHDDGLASARRRLRVVAAVAFALFAAYTAWAYAGALRVAAPLSN